MIAHLVAAVAGLVVMAAPSIFGYSGAAADIDHIVGPIATSIGVIAASQILRAMRWVNVPLGVVLIASTLVVTRTGWGVVVIVAAGATLGATAFVRGEIDVDFAGGWAALWRDRGSEPER